MERKTLSVATVLALLGLGGLGYATRDQWGAPVQVANLPQGTSSEATAEPPKQADATNQQVATAEQPKAETPPASPAQPAAQPAADLPIPSIGTVRIEKDGNAVIAGRAEPGAEITVKLNDKIVATGKANDAGDYAIVPEQPLPPEAGVLTVEMKGKDGKVVPSEQTVAMIGRSPNEAPAAAVLTPGAPTKVVQASGGETAKLPAMATVMIDAVDYDEKGNMVFSGRGPAGSKVQLYADNQPLAEATIGADGTWHIAPAGTITVGAHELRADELAADGSVKSRVGMPFFREDAAKVLASREPPPAQPETKTENQQVAVTTADNKTTVTATAPVTVEVKQPDASAAQPAQAAAPAAEPAQQQQTTAAAQEAPASAPEPAASAAAQPAQPAATEPVEPAQVATAVTPEVDPDALSKSLSKIIIQPGNNLWRLSRRIYGKGTMYTVIYDANREYIKNPDLIYPGQIFVAPKTASGQ